MAELHEELGQCLTRAVLWETTIKGRSLSRNRRHSHAHSSSWDQLPSLSDSRHEEPQPDGLMGTAIHGLTDPHQQALHVAGSAPMLSLAVKGEPPPTHQQDPGSVKSSMPNGWEGIPWWSALSQDAGTHTTGVGCGSIRACCQEIHSSAKLSRLPPLHWTNKVKVSGYTIFSVICTCSSNSKGLKRRKLTQCNQESPQCPPLGIWVPCEGLPSSVPPRPSTKTGPVWSSRWHGWHTPVNHWFASYLGEDHTYEQSNAQHLPAPSVTSTQMPLKRDRDQWCSTPTGGAWPKASTASLTRPVAAGRTQPRCSTTPNLVECQGEWIQVYMAKTRHLPSWWQEFRSLFKENGRELADAFVWKFTTKQATTFRLPAVQADVSDRWEVTCSNHSLDQRNFLPHSDFCGMRDFRETQWEETMVLAWALQHCVEKLGVPSGVLCDAVDDLQRCMAPLMCLKGDDIFEASLLGATDNESRMSPTWAEEAALLGDDPTPQGTQVITTCPSSYPEETPKTEGAAELEWTAADPQGHMEAAAAAATRISSQVGVDHSRPLGHTVAATVTATRICTASSWTFSSEE